MQKYIMKRSTDILKKLLIQSCEGGKWFQTYIRNWWNLFGKMFVCEDGNQTWIKSWNYSRLKCVFW